MDSEVPHLNIEIFPDDVRTPGDKIRRILETLRSDWWLENENVVVSELSTGYVNTNFGLRIKGSNNDGLFLRIITESMDGQKDAVLNAMSYLKKHNLGAQLLLTFENGLVMQLLKGKAVTWDNTEVIKEPKTWLAIAREVARYHAATNWDDVKSFKLWTTMEKINKYNKLHSELREDGRIPVEMSVGIPSAEETMELWLNIVDNLKKAGAETRFCHNDLNPTNILIQDDGVAFVDYDVCQTEFTCFDIARLFITIGGAVDFDFAKMPTEDEKDLFIREYLRSLHEFEPERGPVTGKTVRFFKFLIRKGLLMTWIWAMELAMIIAGVSDRSLDMAIARIAWGEYQRTSSEVLAETFDGNV